MIEIYILLNQKSYKSVKKGFWQGVRVQEREVPKIGHLH